MRGADTFTENLFTLRKLEDFVPPEHPLRSIRKDRKSTRLNSSHVSQSRMPSSA